MKFGILKERKSPPDKRVVFPPQKIAELKKRFPAAEIVVEASDIRIFNDNEYKAAGIQVTDNLADCDVLIGVKEVPAGELIAGKKYFFFSHTIKKQPHNQKMLQSILDNDITLYDHETVTDALGKRLIGFGRYAGIVGTYNAFRAFCLKYDLYDLPKAEKLNGIDVIIERLRKLYLPPIKIVLTGRGKVGMGAKEILDAIKIKQVSPEDFLTKNYDRPVYTQIDVLDYNRRMDGEAPLGNVEFYTSPGSFESDFAKYANVADIFIAGHFHANSAPDILTNQMLADAKCRLKVVADISCDVDGPIACTVRSSTIAEPLYGYHPVTRQEVDMHHPEAIVVMAVDNLPCEIPRDASEGFGEMFLKHVIPAFYDHDANGILQRAMITEHGKLAQGFKYLNGYVKENVPHV
jgi:alanine dehydrogenase